MTKAEILIPDHEGSFSIEHNPHRDCYEKATDYIRESGLQFTSPESYLLAVVLDSIWVCRWYPNGPVRCYEVASSSLEDLAHAVASAVAVLADGKEPQWFTPPTATVTRTDSPDR